MKVSKESLLNYYEIKKENIRVLHDKAKSEEEVQGWNNQLSLIEASILELDLFD